MSQEFISLKWFFFFLVFIHTKSFWLYADTIFTSSPGSLTNSIELKQWYQYRSNATAFTVPVSSAVVNNKLIQSDWLIGWSGPLSEVIRLHLCLCFYVSNRAFHSAIAGWTQLQLIKLNEWSLSVPLTLTIMIFVGAWCFQSNLLYILWAAAVKRVTWQTVAPTVAATSLKHFVSSLFLSIFTL